MDHHIRNFQIYRKCQKNKGDFFMGWASCYEDNLDARGESKSSKSRKPKVPNGREPLRKTDVPVAKTRYVTASEIQRRIHREFIRQEKEFIRQGKKTRVSV